MIKLASVLSKPLLHLVGYVICFVVGAVAGYNWCNSGKQSATLDQLKDDREAVEDVKEQNQERKKETTKIKEVIIREPADDCFDAPGPADADEQLLKAYGRLERP